MLIKDTGEIWQAIQFLIIAYYDTLTLHSGYPRGHLFACLWHIQWSEWLFMPCFAWKLKHKMLTLAEVNP